MKVKHLRFKNLNSLKGDFSIEFDSNSTLGNAGIFAITGPIGAGKTTILDAISVALYGQTPRLDSRDIGNLMSRHTHECYSELEFCVADRHFRSKWMLRRARKKSTGKIQPAIMELSEVVKGEAIILEQLKSSVVGRIEKITGLNFVRFNRSILLAQGNFAAFINAKENERAELLEKMTGTEIYAEISKHIYERSIKEKESIKELKLVLENLDLIDEEHKNELHNKESALKVTLEDGQKSLENKQKQKENLVQIEKLKEEIIKSEAELQKIEEQKNAEADEFERLNQAEKTIPFLREYEAIQNKRSNKTTLIAGLADINKRIPELSSELDTVERSLFKKKGEQEAFLKEFETTKQAALKTRLIDKDIKNLVEASNGLKKESKQVNQELDQANNSLKQSVAMIGEVKAKLTQANHFLEINASYEKLEGLIPVLSERIQQLEELKATQNNLTTEIAVNQETIESTQELDAELQRNEKKFQQTLAGIDREITIVKEEIESISTNEDLHELEEKKEKLGKTDSALNIMKILSTQIVNKNESLETNQEANKKLDEEKVSVQKEIHKLESQVKTEHEILNQLQEKKESDILMAKYEDDRERLIEGEPCPLCGSIDHPWDTSLPTTDSSIDSALKAQKERVEEVEKNHQLLVVLLNEKSAKANHILQQIKILHLELDDLNSKWHSSAVNGNSSLKPDQIKEIESKIEANQKDFKVVKKTIDDMKKKMEKVTTLTQSKTKTEKRIDQIENEIKLNQERQRHVIANNKGLIDSQEKIKRDSYLIAKSIKSELDSFLELSTETNNYDESLAKLSEYAKEYRRYASACIEAEKELVKLSEKKSGFSSQIDRLKGKEAELTEKLNQEDAKIETLQKSRFELFEDKNPEDVEKGLEINKKELDSSIGKLTENSANLNQTLLFHKENALKKDEEINQIKIQVNSLFDEFISKIKAAGFISEQVFADSILNENEFKALKDLMNSITIKETQIRTRLKDAESKMSELVTKEKEIATVDDLNEIIKGIQEDISTHQKELGAIQQTIKQQNEIQLKHDSQLKRIVEKESAYKHWAMLNDLIGSADGKKYRRFAQGITLDYLINLANDHLQKLNDRYYIQRNHQQELGLEVVDTYQANVTRPINTLSGGETFLTSLALALGLSNLASQNTKIDSLFLDEGFGTLDTDSLEIALSVLDNLNVKGKTIGIISHVEALIERIPVQLRVVKKSAGTSTIEIVH